MTYNPTITAARRAAKQLARETGEPYQATLDTVARQAGRADWNEYLGAPVSVPSGATSDDGLYVDGEEHRANTRNRWIAGIGSMPAMLVLPMAFGREVSESGYMLVTGWSVWLMALMMGTMFFDMLAVHPDVPEIGRNGKRERNTAEELARFSMGMSVLAIAGAYLTRNLPTGNLAAVCIATAIALACGGAALLTGALTRSRIATRTLAVMSLNGMAAGMLLAIASLGLR